MPFLDTQHPRVEKRVESRRCIDGHVSVRFTGETLDFDSTAELLTGWVENISQGGLFIRSEFLEIPGTPVLLIITMPVTGETVRLNGRVAWVAHDPPSGPGMGIQLSGKPLGREFLDRLC
jgi:Tfp pilus assembly protein PilZ